MYPGQVIRSAGYSGSLGTHRTGATLFTRLIVHEDFPWIKCYRLQTQESQRTHSCCSVDMMGDETVHTLFLTGLNEVALDAVPLTCCLDAEKESSDVGGC